MRKNNTHGNTHGLFSSVVAGHINKLRAEFKTVRATQIDVVVDDNGREGFDVTYHGTTVAQVRYDGDRVVSMVLDNGGHYTSTTKSRMNDIMQAILGYDAPRVSQTKGVWNLHLRDMAVGFQRGIDAAVVFGSLN